MEGYSNKRKSDSEDFSESKRINTGGIGAVDDRDNLSTLNRDVVNYILSFLSHTVDLFNVAMCSRRLFEFILNELKLTETNIKYILLRFSLEVRLRGQFPRDHVLLRSILSNEYYLSMIDEKSYMDLLMDYSLSRKKGHPESLIGSLLFSLLPKYGEQFKDHRCRYETRSSSPVISYNTLNPLKIMCSRNSIYHVDGNKEDLLNLPHHLHSFPYKRDKCYDGESGPRMEREYRKSGPWKRMTVRLDYTKCVYEICCLKFLPYVIYKEVVTTGIDERIEMMLDFMENHGDIFSMIYPLRMKFLDNSFVYKRSELLQVPIIVLIYYKIYGSKVLKKKNSS
jgi:hypothetical protein